MSTAERTHTGVLEMHPKGHGFLRDPARNFKAGTTDVIVGSPFLSRFQLRQGVRLTGLVDEAKKGEGPRLSELIEIEGKSPELYLGLRRLRRPDRHRPPRGDPPRNRPEPLGMRVMDLLTPVGKGQRGLIVAPPRTGKTILLQQIAAAVAKNHPELHLIVLLIDERPEEVTDMRRSVKGEVIASSSDHAIEEHIRLAQLTVDRAKRIAEGGGQVLILLDSLTRLARAYNKGSNSGRTMSGGMDIKALDVPKRLFGAARNFEEGGSLTVLATCLIETGSRMDELIFQEFKGTGNMECVLEPAPGRAPGLAGDRHPAVGNPQGGVSSDARDPPARHPPPPDPRGDEAGRGDGGPGQATRQVFE